MLTQILRLALALLLGSVIGFIAFAVTAMALRPFGPITDAFNLTPPELVLAAVIGLVFGIAATWRLRKPDALKRELSFLGKVFTDSAGQD
ncbi:MAG: hypothetical protein RLZZ369_819 [Pseudomonadota bacterium]|jgi:uncharacterized membrane protein YhiD involved in acid resistance